MMLCPFFTISLEISCIIWVAFATHYEHQGDNALEESRQKLRMVKPNSLTDVLDYDSDFRSHHHDVSLQFSPPDLATVVEDERKRSLNNMIET